MESIHLTIAEAPKGAAFRIVRGDGISFLAFTKHATFAGLGPDFGPYPLLRRLVQTMDFLQYWDGPNGRFHLPRVLRNDPTELNYISNRIGRALADYCAKRITGARFTHCYESAMRAADHPIRGRRPDFYCDTLTKQFAVEAKGYSRRSISDLAMKEHKRQAKTGPLSVHFSKASVSYNLYREPKIKYYDPPSEAEYNDDLNRQLRADYYKSIFETLEVLPKSEPFTIGNVEFAAFSIHPFFRNGTILVHPAVFSEAFHDSDDWLMKIPAKGLETETAFVDSDGIGIGWSWDQPSTIRFSGGP
jgi:hypothetical protein